MLFNINSIISIIVLGFSNYFFIKEVSDEDNSLRRDFIFFFFISLILTLTTFNIIVLLKPIFNILAITIMFSYIYKIDIKKSLALSFLLFLVMFFCELIILILVLLFFGSDLEIILDIFIKFNVANYLSSIFIFLVTIRFKTFFVSLAKKINKVPINIITINIINTIFLITYFYIGMNKIFKFNATFFIELFVIILIIVMLATVIISSIRNINVTKKHNNLLDSLSTFENILKEQKIKNHENKNQLLTLKSLVPKRNKKFHTYISSLIEDSSDNLKINQLSLINSTSIKGFLYYKVNEIQKKGINVIFNISKDIEYVNFPQDSKFVKSITQLLGIYLDNACEAAQETSKKIISIELYIDNYIYFIISNTFDLENKKSSKGLFRGHGLLLANQIIEHSNLYTSKFEIKENYYVQELKININH